MKRELRVLAAAGWLAWAMCAADAAYAQKTGGILKLGHFDSPASMSMLEESTQAVNRPMSGAGPSTRTESNAGAPQPA